MLKDEVGPIDQSDGLRLLYGDKITQGIYEELIEEYRLSPLRNIKIPDMDHPQEFYDDFGHFPHPYKRDSRGFPTEVEKLAEYQIKAWGEKDVIVVKSNKVGLTTTFSLETFQSRLMPKHAGFDALLVAQTQKMANEHLLNLKKMVRMSDKYAQFVIERPDYELFKEEKSKLASMYIRNPFNPLRPSRIIALGGSEASAYSWKNVDWIHMSDVSQLQSNDQRLFFGALFSRLANTNGIAKIETIPGAREGEVWRLWQVANKEHPETDPTEQLAEDTTDVSSVFEPMKITYMDGIKEGIISPEYIDRMRRILDEFTFRQLFMAEFVEVENQWYKEAWLKASTYTVTM